MLNEFKQFVARGNVMDLAVGVIIGAAFSKIVDSIVNDLVMPVVGALTGGGFDFSNYFVALSGNVTANTLAAAREQGAVLAYGNFITILINFLILAWIIFLMVKGVNRLRESVERDKKEGVAETAPPPEDVVLLTEIRDLLKQPRVSSQPGAL
ncbi:large conductance mechanosensitive channel protein MscL [Pararhizobium gei]|uniref:large conductance mechanosensitive channel protein MscL n=1 Tax=Pararhizobium gei TaxID=1395951 RepID=UPI0023DC364B|nr:large conductance mechanosensitive channel protein MscL [Rhizobium gei]